ncbi:hypothetical protein ACHAXT_001223 [Thalassiosira profunda]
MASISNLVPVRVDASSSDGTVRIIDTLVVDTTCLPISHAHPPHDGSSSGLGALSRGKSEPNNFSMPSLLEANASHLAEQLIADAEVQGAVRTNSRTFMGGRLDLLGDAKLRRGIEKQIWTQLSIAMGADKKGLVSGGKSLGDGASLAPDGASSADVEGDKPLASSIVRIKLRLRHENIVVFDEFDYDVNTSGMEGSDPFSIAKSIVKDLKLPPELAPTIAASIVEQIYGVDVSGSVEAFTSTAAVRKTPTALVLDATKEGGSSDFAQIQLNS